MARHTLSSLIRAIRFMISLEAKQMLEEGREM
jgi:hypothetical protein